MTDDDSLEQAAGPVSQSDSTYILYIDLSTGDG
jgi:hypothetical protein